MGKYLEQWFDPQMVDAAFDIEEFAQAQRERLCRTYMLADYAGNVPRRIGNATPHELATDKKWCRLLCVRMNTALALWRTDGEDYDIDDFITSLNGEDIDKLRSKAAQVDWAVWFENYAANIRNTLVTLASNTLNAKDRELYKAGNRYASRLVNEAVQLEKAYKKVFDQE